MTHLETRVRRITFFTECNGWPVKVKPGQLLFSTFPAGRGPVQDNVAEEAEQEFKHFLEEWRGEGDCRPKYLEVSNVSKS